ncbi:MAG TPA: hypothetical protein VG889_11160 [Rhizomicrobium sp.]|nr:hypothetical protein [Rhizomicrobium sp.]
MRFDLIPVAAAAILAAATPAQAALTIGWGATINMHCSGGVCISTNSDAVMGVKDLQRRLALGKLTIVADTLANDIVVEAPFSWTSANGLELFAAHSIRIDKTVDVAGPGALTLTTNDSRTDGTLSFGAHGNLHFWSTSNSLTIDYATYTLVNSVAGLASAVAAHPANNFALAADYDATPDGTRHAAAVTTTFTGKFNGLGNAISHLKFRSNPASNSSLGLFRLSMGGTIANLKLKAEQIFSHFNDTVGGIVASNQGPLTGSSVQGTFQLGNAVVGGIAGINFGTIRDCHANMRFVGHDGSVGGIVGGNGFGGNNQPGIVELSSSEGTINVTGAVDAGGIAGTNSGTLRASWSSMAVTVGAAPPGPNAPEAGGLAGRSYIQFNIATVGDSYATGAVTGGNGSFVGGLIGAFGRSTLSSAYSTGAVSGAGATRGGLIGRVLDTATIADTYWDTTTSGIASASQGAGNVSNQPGITGLTDIQLKSGLPAGFGSTVWGHDSGINSSLPYLIANLPN